MTVAATQHYKAVELLNTDNISRVLQLKLILQTHVRREHVCFIALNSIAKELIHSITNVCFISETGECCNMGEL